MTESENENDHFDLDHFDHLKELREANDLTQEQMSSYLGIGRSAYANYEAGERETPGGAGQRLQHRVPEEYTVECE